MPVVELHWLHLEVSGYRRPRLDCVTVTIWNGTGCCEGPKRVSSSGDDESERERRRRARCLFK
jgi:hypothetical protein